MPWPTETSALITLGGTTHGGRDGRMECRAPCPGSESRLGGRWRWTEAVSSTDCHPERGRGGGYPPAPPPPSSESLGSRVGVKEQHERAINRAPLVSHIATTQAVGGRLEGGRGHGPWPPNGDAQEHRR